MREVPGRRLRKVSGDSKTHSIPVDAWSVPLRQRQYGGDARAVAAASTTHLITFFTGDLLANDSPSLQNATASLQPLSAQSGWMGRTRSLPLLLRRRKETGIAFVSLEFQVNSALLPLSSFSVLVLLLSRCSCACNAFHRVRERINTSGKRRGKTIGRLRGNNKMTRHRSGGIVDEDVGGKSDEFRRTLRGGDSHKQLPTSVGQRRAKHRDQLQSVGWELWILPARRLL